MPEQTSLGLRQPPSVKKGIFLCHNEADKPWVEMLADRIADNSPDFFAGQKSEYLKVTQIRF